MALLVIASPISSAVVEEADNVLVLSGVTLIDGTGGLPREDTSIVIRGEAIEAIVRGRPEPMPERARVLDLAGKFVVPGLFDVHTHLATDPAAEGFDERLRLTLRSFLAHGVCDVRDMAGDGRVLAEYARLTASGEVPGPDLHFAALLAGPDYFGDPRIRAASVGVEVGQAPWAHAITDETDLPALMAEIAAFGARGVKVYANVPPLLLGATAEAARDAGLGVWSHWVVQPRQTHALDAVHTGVDVVSHAYMLMHQVPPDQRTSWRATFDGAGGAELVEAMLARGTVLDATIVAAVGMRVPPGSGWEDPVTTGAEITRHLHEAGVPIATGSDAPARDGVPAIHSEYALLVERAGFEPLEVLESATRISATALGLDAQRGTLEVGKQATLLVLDADPAASVTPLLEPRWVIQRGVLYSGANLRDLAVPVAPVELEAAGD